MKFIKTGEILKCRSFDPKSQLIEVELPTGEVSTLKRHEVARITPVEEVEFLRSREKAQITHSRLPAR